MIDEKLLLDLLHIPSGDNTKVMQDYIIDFLVSNNITNFDYENGIIFNTSIKNRPLLSAHLDTVQTSDDEKLVDYIKIKNGIVKGYGVIGGDDKCGIYIILDLLRKRNNFNFIFSVDEETGSFTLEKMINRLNFDNILYGLILDRKGNSDIICEKNGYGTKEFEQAILDIAKKYNYKSAMGSFSDADKINEFISCANLSVGYYEAHSKYEFISLVDLEKAENLVVDIIDTIQDKFKGYSGIYSRYYSDDYLYGYKTEYLDSSYDTILEYCPICGQLKHLKHINTIDMSMCFDCIKDLYDEIYENAAIFNEISY